jgi:hypothetical protein
LKFFTMQIRYLLLLRLFLLLLLISYGALSVPVLGTTPTSTAEHNTIENVAQDIFPLSKTAIKLSKQNITLDWYENTTIVKGSYRLVNPENKTIKLKLGLNIPPPNNNIRNNQEENSPLLVYIQEEEVTTSFNQKLNSYVWEIQIEPSAEVELEILYNLQNSINEQQQSHQIGFHFPWAKNKFWPTESYDFTLTLNFKDTHPGQIIKLEPNNYFFLGDSLHWVWKTTEEKKDIIITIDTQGESKDWLALLSTKNKKQLLNLTSQGYYYEAAAFIESKYYDFTKTEEKQLILLGQAYYLQKAGDEKRALGVFANLVKNDAPFPRAYWEVGKSYEQHTNKLAALYNQIQELQIHALLQPWLIAKLPGDKVKLSSPEVTIKYADTNEGRKGIIIKSQATDKDGDITKITLRYNWEGEKEKEINFAIKPFQYNYDLLHFTIAPGPFKQLYYQWEITDAAGHKVTTEMKEAFYLNEEIKSDTYILEGANLILGDYTTEEQTKVQRWFKSYLKMANEAGFVPVKARSPLLIFMGQEHDFFKEYQGPLFVYHTPTPFSPNTTRIPVHRYFLGYWYGQGWHTLPLNELTKLGDALMLNKGWQAHVFSYLQNKNHQLFAQLLYTIGEGKNWTEALSTTYHLTPFKLNLLTIWYFIGNYVLALLIIILFAWLSKKGHLYKLIQHFKTTK